MRAPSFSIALAFFSTVFLVAAGADHQNISELSLARTLLKDYDKGFRPVKDFHQTLRVSLRLDIYSIIRVVSLSSFNAFKNEAKENVRMLLWFKQGWKDDYLSWSPRDWGSIKSINIPTEKIWTPDGQIYNRYADFLANWELKRKIGRSFSDRRSCQSPRGCRSHLQQGLLKI